MFRSLKRVLLLSITLIALTATVSLSVGQGTSDSQSASLPVWQAGDSIRSTLFDVQRLLFSANRADDPGEIYANAADQTAEALTVYTTELQPVASQLAPDAEEAVTSAFAEAQAAIDAQDANAFAAARGRIWTSLLWVSATVVEQSLTNGDVDTASAWLRLREYRQATTVTVVDSPASQALNALENDETTIEEAQNVVLSELRDAYFFHLRDTLSELQSAASEGYTVRAAEWAGQLQGYFDILRADYASKLGEDSAQTVADTFAQLEPLVLAEDWENVLAQIPTLHGQIASYQPVELSPELIAERGRLLYLFLDLVYVEYRDGVRGGEITVPIEYQEATTFLAQARSIYEELRGTIASRDTAAAEQLDANLAQLDQQVADLVDPSEVQTVVTASLTLVETTLQVRADSGDTASTFTVIDTLLDEIIVAAEDGRYTEAERTRIEAYGLLESGPELRLANRAPLLTRELEGLFWEGTGGESGLYTLLAQEADSATIAATVDRLKGKLTQAQAFISEGLTTTVAAVNSATIIIREGLEAVLIIGAVLAYMFKTGAQRRYIAWVFVGVIAAIALSVATWFAAQTFLTITPLQRELIEGVTSLIAVVVLFYVTNWLFHKAYVVDWMTFVREQTSRALNSGGAFGLAFLGFTVVYREGLETVLFYQALLFDAQPAPVLLGFVVGLVLILAIAWVILRLSKRIPLKPLFTVTTILLLVLAFSFTGAGVRELQEAGVVGTTLLPWFPENVLLMELFGLFPTLQTVLAQVIFVLLIAVTFTYSRWQGKRDNTPAQRPQTPQGAKS